jgi:hypothetical protein
MGAMQFRHSIDSTEAMGHFTSQAIYQGVPHLHYLSERRGLEVSKLDCQAYKWRFETNRSSLKKLICYILHLEVTKL